MSESEIKTSLAQHWAARFKGLLDGLKPKNNDPAPPVTSETTGTYPMTWITAQLAVGHAPMSYEELDFIKGNGIVAIVNLCGEFCDLHEIEKKTGFEIYYLPIPDECAPDMEAMEAALHWLDEALYLKKKILIHCRHGHGRTGTFVSAYLLRRGLSLNFTEKTLNGTRANPTNYSQWQLLRKYRKQQGSLNARQPSIENETTIDLNPFLGEYQNLLADPGEIKLNPEKCCRTPFSLYLVEAVFLSQAMSGLLSQTIRHTVLTKALKVSKNIKDDGDDPSVYTCPLLEDDRCLLHEYRPMHCRLQDCLVLEDGYDDKIRLQSKEIFLALTTSFPLKKIYALPWLTRCLVALFNNIFKP